MCDREKPKYISVRKQREKNPYQRSKNPKKKFQLEGHDNRKAEGKHNHLRLCEGDTQLEEDPLSHPRSWARRQLNAHLLHQPHPKRLQRIPPNILPPPSLQNPHRPFPHLPLRPKHIHLLLTRPRFLTIRKRQPPRLDRIPHACVRVVVYDGETPCFVYACRGGG